MLSSASSSSLWEGRSPRHKSSCSHKSSRSLKRQMGHWTMSSSRSSSRPRRRSPSLSSSASSRSSRSPSPRRRSLCRHKSHRRRKKSFSSTSRHSRRHWRRSCSRSSSRSQSSNHSRSKSVSQKRKPSPWTEKPAQKLFSSGLGINPRTPTLSEVETTQSEPEKKPSVPELLGTSKANCEWLSIYNEVDEHLFVNRELPPATDLGLQKIDTFSGDVITSWPAFKAAVDSCINYRMNLDWPQKQHVLLSSVSGYAKQLIEDFHHDREGYAKSLYVLDNEFGSFEEHLLSEQEEALPERSLGSHWRSGWELRSGCQPRWSLFSSSLKERPKCDHFLPSDASERPGVPCSTPPSTRQHFCGS